MFYLTSVNPKWQDKLTYFNRIENKMSISFRYQVVYMQWNNMTAGCVDFGYTLNIYLYVSKTCIICALKKWKMHFKSIKKLQ